MSETPRDQWRVEMTGVRVREEGCLYLVSNLEVSIDPGASTWAEVQVVQRCRGAEVQRCSDAVVMGKRSKDQKIKAGGETASRRDGETARGEIRLSKCRSLPAVSCSFPSAEKLERG